MTLEDEERLRFAAYCRESARANRGLVEQMQRIRTLGAIIEKYEREADALDAVAAILEKTESYK
jgi:hypothetical protein